MKTVRRCDELEVLALKRRGRIVVVYQPGSCIDDELDADQPAFISHRLVNQCFGVHDFNLTIAKQLAIDVMNAHGAVVGPADAAKSRPVAGEHGIVYVKELD